MSQAVNRSYSLAALLVHATKQEVTKEKIAAVLSALNVETSLKVASMFELPSQKYTDMLSNTGSAAPATSAQPSAAGTAAQQVVEEEEKEESDSDNVIGF